MLSVNNVIDIECTHHSFVRRCLSTGDGRSPGCWGAYGVLLFSASPYRSCWGRRRSGGVQPAGGHGCPARRLERRHTERRHTERRHTERRHTECRQPVGRAAHHSDDCSEAELDAAVAGGFDPGGSAWTSTAGGFAALRQRLLTRAQPFREMGMSCGGTSRRACAA